MARGKTLGELVNQLRIAARYDPNPALSQSMVPLFEQTLKDTQERLYDQFDWPFLKVRRDKELSAGQRYYDIPADLNLERVQAVDVKVGNFWQPVERGITLDHYSAIDSDLDARQDPVQRWDAVDTDGQLQIEVWPVPLSDGGILRFSGIRKLRPLVSQGDRADLDDQLIVLYAAGELMGGVKNPEAQLKLSQAKNRLETLQGRVVKTRRKGFVLGGGGEGDGRGYPRGAAIVSVQPQG